MEYLVNYQLKPKCVKCKTNISIKTYCKKFCFKCIIQVQNNIFYIKRQNKI